MRIEKLEENFYRYQFPSDDKNSLGKNIFVILENHQALLIDAGYEEDSRLILDDLTKKGIRAAKVILSHFHPDHVEGILVMDKPEVLGNKNALKTLSRFYEEETLAALSPNILITSESKIQFGGYTLTFEEAPGHSDCSLLININDQYLLVGDLFIRTETGEEVLPYVQWSGVEQHIDSLKKILEHKEKTFLFGHGLCPLGYAEISAGIRNRIIYLQALLDSNNTVSAEEAVKNCSRPFLFLKWREYVK